MVTRITTWKGHRTARSARIPRFRCGAPRDKFLAIYDDVRERTWPMPVAFAAVAAGGMAYPDALEDYLAAELTAAHQVGDVDAARDARTEVTALLALTNGLTPGILAGQRTHAAAAVLEYALDTLFTGPRAGREIGGPPPATRPG